MEAKFQIFLILLAVLAGTALLARRHRCRAGHPVAAGRHRARLCAGNAGAGTAAELVLLLVLPPLIYSASVAMSWREFKFNLRPIILLSVGCVIFTALRGRRRDALSDRAAVEHRIPARRHRRAAGRGGAAGDRPQARTAAPDSRGARGRGAGERRHRADPVSLRGGGDFDRHVLAAEGDGEFVVIVAGEVLVRRRGGLAQPARASSRPRSADRDHAVADHALCRLLGARAFRRLRRDRYRRLRALHELERAAVDLFGDPAAGHLLLGPRDLPDRGPAVPADRLPDALAVREVQGVSA